MTAWYLEDIHLHGVLKESRSLQRGEALVNLLKPNIRINWYCNTALISLRKGFPDPPYHISALIINPIYYHIRQPCPEMRNEMEGNTTGRGSRGALRWAASTETHRQASRSLAAGGPRQLAAKRTKGQRQLAARIA